MRVALAWLRALDDATRKLADDVWMHSQYRGHVVLDDNWWMRRNAVSGEIVIPT